MLSVIIPCYNCAATLPAALDSLEPYGQALEVIAVNDGSTDETGQLLADFAARTSLRFAVHTKENGGVSAARNDGIARSHGDYLLFLDADDLFAPALITRLQSLLDTQQPDTIAFRMTHDEALLTSADLSLHADAAEPLALLRAYTASKHDLHFGSFLYRRTLLVQHGITFTEGARYGEDFEFLTKYLAHCHTALLLDAPAYCYRLSAGSVTRTCTYAQTDAIAAARRAAAYLEELHHPFAAEFMAYMPARAAFSVARRLAAGDKSLFLQLSLEEDMCTLMRQLLTHPMTDKKTRLAARLFLLSPTAFRLLASLAARL